MVASGPISVEPHPVTMKTGRPRTIAETSDGRQKTLGCMAALTLNMASRLPKEDA